MNTLTDNLKSAAPTGKINIINFEITAISYPIVGRIGERITDNFFLSVNQPTPQRKRPYASVILDAENGSVLRYTDCSGDDFAKETGIALDETVNYSAQQGVEFSELQKVKKQYMQEIL